MAPLSHLDPRRSVGSSRIGSIVHSRLFNKRSLWIWPLLAIPLMAVLGYMIFSWVEKAIQDNAASQLTAVLNADVEALQIWMNLQESTVEATVHDPQVASLTREILALAAAPNARRESWANAPQQAQLAAELAPKLKAGKYHRYVLLDDKFRVVSGSSPELIDQSFPFNDPVYEERFAAGRPFVTRPYPSVVMLEDVDGEKRAGVPTMFAVAPIQDEGKTIGALGLRIQPSLDFTRILAVGNFGETGETYAFDKHGLVLSGTRFDKELKQLNLIPDNSYSTAILNLQLKDPQVDLTSGARAAKPRSEQPLVGVIAKAVSGESGVDVHPYSDYLGQKSIGAWQWLPEYGMGVITEVDASEAFRAAYIVRAVHWGMFALMCALSLGIFAFTIVLAKMQRSAREASLAAKKVGQYQLEEKLGQGGMGVVYRGQHAMLRRPTAVKLLDPAKTTDESIGRFEREVRLTSLLNHPNTITIYDYGRTDEGVFYYAMELLSGIDLEELVRQYGAQPPARVVSLLMQVCGSLSEAHGAGLIHRDIKPGNIMLTQRGGISDFIKVLDFGLVKAVSTGKEANLTMANTLTGTPLYMSPEAIERADDVDARSDLYAVGAVGYFLLTGQPVFKGESVVDICMAQVSKQPERPSQRVNRVMPTELEETILKCLAKKPEERPQSARELASLLARVPLEKGWTDDDARAWWAGFSRPELLETRDIGTRKIAMETKVIPSSPNP